MSVISAVGDRHVVRGYYSTKTPSILRKYGPGPRVHFHIGFFAEDDQREVLVDAESMRRGLVESQEELVRQAATVWDAPRSLCGNILDVGCGLGGGALYWAQEIGARVTAVTDTEEHLQIIGEFAAQAGVGDAVIPVLADSCAIPGAQIYDGAVAMESACYFPRPRWFRHLARRIRPGGFVCIEDTFLGHPKWKGLFNDYWRTDVAPVDEYIEAAGAAGFVLDRRVDVTAHTTPFWRRSIAWVRQVLGEGREPAEERRRLERSLDWHHFFHRAWVEGGITVQLLRFRHEGGEAKQP